MDTVKEIRRRKGWSQKDLAEESGVGQDTISGIESGRHEPRPSTLRKLADALDVEVADFFREPAVPLPEAPRRAGLSEASSFHMVAETFKGAADLLRWQLDQVQPEQLPSLVYEGIAVADRAALQKRQDVDPVLNDALEEELAAAQEVEKALSAIEDALYAIGEQAKRQNKAIAAGVEDQLAARRRRRARREAG
jgi:transcriptional regulator with XRE-family HTH domain